MTSGSDNQYADYGPPRRVSGGLRARSARGAIGDSWWSRRFVAVLESFALGTRLTRGRAYARAGQVLSLQVGPGAVTATVQGSRPRPYRVRIGLPVLPETVWSTVEESLAAQAFFSARLLAGDLPPELEGVFTEVGTPLFPRRAGELDQHCTCPDAAVPCKHLAATFYLLAEAFDADPFELLHWRGRSRTDLLDRLRRHRRGVPRGVADADSPPSGSVGSESGLSGSVVPDSGPSDSAVGLSGGGTTSPVVGAGRVLAELSDIPVTATVERFWLPPVPLPARRPPVLVTEPDLLLRQLSPPASAIGGIGLTQRLNRAYRNFGDQRPTASGGDNAT